MANCLKNGECQARPGPCQSGDTSVKFTRLPPDQAPRPERRIVSPFTIIAFLFLFLFLLFPRESKLSLVALYPNPHQANHHIFFALHIPYLLAPNSLTLCDSAQQLSDVDVSNIKKRDLLEARAEGQTPTPRVQPRRKDTRLRNNRNRPVAPAPVPGGPRYPLKEWDVKRVSDDSSWSPMPPTGPVYKIVFTFPPGVNGGGNSVQSGRESRPEQRQRQGERIRDPRLYYNGGISNSVRRISDRRDDGAGNAFTNPDYSRSRFSSSGSSGDGKRGYGGDDSLMDYPSPPSPPSSQSQGGPRPYRPQSI